ncbi:hypothetical protein [Chitinibacter tainanensis]|uniref:hypothetical protein n=1 Tax=Chitinibacter tainanensis TaxID=230667 RepID=UPI000417B61F|nr:hypothetical protein [Chitinibacter tainanensis]
MKSVGAIATLLPVVVVGLFCCALILGVLVPIYSDEIAVHLSHARFFFDGFVITGLFPQCGDATWLRTPRWFEYPAILLYPLFYPSGNALHLRIAGIVWALVTIYIFWFLCGKFAATLKSRVGLFAFAISICALGPLPYVLVLARSEQVLLLCIVVISLVALFFPICPNDTRARVLAKWGFWVSLLSVFYFAHPKSIFFTPLIFVALYFFSRSIQWWLRLISFLLLSAVTAIFVFDAKNVIQCSAAPGAAKALSSNVANYPVWGVDFFACIGQVSNNIQVSIVKIASRLFFEPVYQSFWLPAQINSSQSSVMASNLNSYIHVFILSALCLIVLLVVAISMRQLVSKKILDRHLLALSLLLSLCAHLVVYNPSAWHFYTPGLIIPVFVLAFLLIAPDLFYFYRGRVQLLYMMAVPFYILALLSLFTLLQTTIPYLMKAAREGEVIIHNQLLSTPNFLSKSSAVDLETLVQQCGIPSVGASRLAVDGTAYGFMQNLHQPIYMLYVGPIGFGMDIKDLRQFLISKKSDGVLSRCDYLSPALIQRSLQSNGMCCLSRRHLAVE